MKKFNLAKVFLLVVCIMVLIFLTACKDKAQNTGELSGKVTASGSSALLPLLKAGQEDFYKKYAKITLNISAGGSFTGQNQVISGYVDIGNSDVALQKSLQNKGLVEHVFVGIPFIFIANKDVTVDSLTKQQYKDIFTGKITNWNQVGGKDQKIIVIGRSLSSGSRITIEQKVMDAESFTDEQIIQDSNGALRTAVATTPGAIGYVDAAYASPAIKVLSYNGEKYSIDNVQNGKYPIYALGRMYTKGEPKGAVKAFIDFVKSDEFQKQYVQDNSFIPMDKIKY